MATDRTELVLKSAGVRPEHRARSARLVSEVAVALAESVEQANTDRQAERHAAPPTYDRSNSTDD